MKLHSILSILFIAFLAVSASAQTALATPEPLFKFADGRLREVSGLAVSHQNAGLMWMHNDSGDTARAFAINASGKVAAVVNLEGVEARDFEDMALAGDWIYLADIGDNFAVRENLSIYRFREPRIAADANDKEINLKNTQFETMTLHFPDGPRDCESLAATPDGRLLLVSKEPNGSHLYALDAPFTDKTSATLRKFAEFRFGATGFFTKLATGADFSPDGRTLAVTTYAQIYQFPLAAPFDFATLSWNPSVLTLPSLKQCECVAFSADGKSLLVSSEGQNQPVYELKAAP